MIKKILKLTVAVMTLGLFTTSVFAADWGISGQVRVNWDVSKTIQNDTGSTDREGIASGKSRTPNGVFIDEDYSWITFDLAGENESAYILYYPGGGAEYGGTATAESGEWAATATINTRNYVSDSSARSGYNNQGNRSGDHHVKLAHSSGFSVLLGRDTVLDGWRRGRANLLLGDTGGTGHIQGDAPSANSDALDARANIVDIGILNSDTLSIGLVIEQKDSGISESFGAAFGGLTFGGNKHIASNVTVAVADVAVEDAAAAGLAAEVNSLKVAADAADATFYDVEIANAAAAYAAAVATATAADAAAAAVATATAADAAAYATATAADAAAYATAVAAAADTQTASNTAALDNLRAAVAVADAADAADANAAAVDAANAANAAAVVAAADANAAAVAAAAGGSAVAGVASTNIGIRAGVKAGPLDLGLTFVSGSEAGDASLGGNAAYKASGTALGLGVGLNLGAITPFLNIWMPSTKSENQFGKDETSTSNTNIGVDYALNETSGISFSSVTRESTVKVTTVVAGDTVTGEAKTKKAAIELGYNTNIGGSAVKVGLVQATETDASEKEVTVSWLRVRFQQSF